MNPKRPSPVPTWILPLLLFLGCSLSTRAAAIRDEAHLFSDSAVRQAEETIRNLTRQSHKDLVIETFAGVPERHQALYEANRERFFDEFLIERARAARVDGIYVLLLKEPPPHNIRIQAGVGQNTRQRAFRLSDRDQLVHVLQGRLRDRQYDEGLREAVTFVDQTLRRNLASHTAAGARRGSSESNAARENGPGSWIPLILFIILGILVVRFILRLFSGGMGGGGGGGYAPGMGGGGGGFLSSLLGGIGGAIAGSWLYDRFLGANAQANDWADRGDQSSGSDVGSDFSSSGGDSDDSGGSDFGDSNFGGGDSGGGDA